METGCVALSSGLIYLPGAHGKKRRWRSCARRFGRTAAFYVTHIRNEADEGACRRWTRPSTSHRTRVPLHISHSKIMGRHNFGSIDRVFASWRRRNGKGWRSPLKAIRIRRA